jgi:hypothetical protein
MTEPIYHDPSVVAPPANVTISIWSKNNGFGGIGMRVDLPEGQTDRSFQLSDRDGFIGPRVEPYVDPVTGVKFHLQSCWDEWLTTYYGPKHQMQWAEERSEQ